ncbi:hypothetical protein Dimus_012134, partial [Dionaea muscipula]
PNYIFFGVDVIFEVAKLRDEYALPFLRTREARAEAKCGGLYGLDRSKLRIIARDVAELHMKKPKRVSMSNREQNRVLTEEQIEHACIDAYASYKIGRKMLIEKANELYSPRLVFSLILEQPPLCVLGHMVGWWGREG